jgi:hypothetical protein
VLNYAWKLNPFGIRKKLFAEKMNGLAFLIKEQQEGYAFVNTNVNTKSCAV